MECESEIKSVLCWLRNRAEKILFVSVSFPGGSATRTGREILKTVAL